MNIIESRKQQRKETIIKIQKVLREIVKEGKKLNKKSLVIMCMAEFELSKRTSIDYLEVALYDEGIKI